MEPLRAYVDESGTHSRDAVLCLAVSVSTESLRTEFENEWRPVVANLAKGYHAADCPRLAPHLAAVIAKTTLLAHIVTIAQT